MNEKYVVLHQMTVFNTVDLLIIQHTNHKCLELIAFHKTKNSESTRLYVDLTVLNRKVAESILRYGTKDFDKNDTNVVTYLVSRLLIPNLKDGNKLVIRLIATTDFDVIQDRVSKRLDIQFITKPDDLIPYKTAREAADSSAYASPTDIDFTFSKEEMFSGSSNPVHVEHTNANDSDNLDPRVKTRSAKTTSGVTTSSCESVHSRASRASHILRRTSDVDHAKQTGGQTGKLFSQSPQSGEVSPLPPLGKPLGLSRNTSECDIAESPGSNSMRKRRDSIRTASGSFGEFDEFTFTKADHLTPCGTSGSQSPNVTGRSASPSLRKMFDESPPRAGLLHMTASMESMPEVGVGGHLHRDSFGSLNSQSSDDDTPLTINTESPRLKETNHSAALCSPQTHCQERDRAPSAQLAPLALQYPPLFTKGTGIADVSPMKRVVGTRNALRSLASGGQTPLTDPMPLLRSRDPSPLLLRPMDGVSPSRKTSFTSPFCLDSEEDAMNAINNALLRSPVAYSPSMSSGLMSPGQSSAQCSVSLAPLLTPKVSMQSMFDSPDDSSSSATRPFSRASPPRSHCASPAQSPDKRSILLSGAVGIASPFNDCTQPTVPASFLRQFVEQREEWNSMTFSYDEEEDEVENKVVAEVEVISHDEITMLLSPGTTSGPGTVPPLDFDQLTTTSPAAAGSSAACKFSARLPPRSSNCNSLHTSPTLSGKLYAPRLLSDE